MKSVRGFFLAIAALSIGIAGYSQTIDEIVNKHVDAIGGKEAWGKVNSIRQEGIVSVQGTDVNLILTKQKGKGMRQDISVMNMNGFQIVTPTNGWSFMPFQGQTEVDSISAGDLKKLQDGLDIGDPLVTYKEKGYTAEVAGKENINGSEATKIVITKKDGEKQTVFVDNKSNYIVRTISKQSMNGQEQEVTNEYSNFQKVPEGIVVPMTITLPFGELVLSKIEINKPVDENFFKPIK
ncbi:MAG TPA: hypothetical protein VM012_01480 [Flavitalea sp.]|nr:hypothetical protein [Flavitalea sp.]